ncbi:MAG TPA: ornithine carbamoyltransferase [Actinomycetales bacterium]|nr:ornithine carbamoyltransferase [Actinomycetales bacterium]
MTDLRGRDFLRELDFSASEWTYLLDLSASLKATGRGGGRLAGQVFALLFEKTSTRTRCAFEVAAYHEGANVTYLDPQGSQMGHKESVADTARVLARMYDGIEHRGDDHGAVTTLAEYSSVPVWNGLSDLWHPTQTLADQLTLREVTGKADREISFAYVGDGRNNVANSLLVGAALIGQDVRIVAPPQLQPEAEVVAEARRLAEASGARLTITDDPGAVAGVDAVYTDVWVSMGEKKSAWAERIEWLKPYQVNSALMAAAGEQARFLHCLPAFHDQGTTVGQEVYTEFGLKELEVTDEVFESDASVVFQQAENRLHTIKAVMVATASPDVVTP